MSELETSLGSLKNISHLSSPLSTCVTDWQCTHWLFWCFLILIHKPWTSPFDIFVSWEVCIHPLLHSSQVSCPTISVIPTMLLFCDSCLCPRLTRGSYVFTLSYNFCYHPCAHHSASFVYDPPSTSTWLKCRSNCLFPMDLSFKLFSFQLDYVSIGTEKRSIFLVVL